MSDNPFLILKNEQLSSVIFIQDYLQLDFDGHILTCYDWPILKMKNLKIMFPDVRYRNYLCDFISKNIIDVGFEDTQNVILNFDNDNIIFFDLMEKTNEVIYFKAKNGEWSSV